MMLIDAIADILLRGARSAAIELKSATTTAEKVPIMLRTAMV
jgi:hypothetical protein